MKFKEIIGNITKNTRNGQPTTYLKTKVLIKNKISLTQLKEAKLVFQNSKNAVKKMMEETDSRKAIKEMMYEED